MNNSDINFRAIIKVTYHTHFLIPPPKKPSFLVLLRYLEAAKNQVAVRWFQVAGGRGTPGGMMLLI